MKSLLCDFVTEKKDEDNNKDKYSGKENNF